MADALDLEATFSIDPNVAKTAEFLAGLFELLLGGLYRGGRTLLAERILTASTVIAINLQCLSAARDAPTREQHAMEFLHGINMHNPHRVFGGEMHAHPDAPSWPRFVDAMTMEILTLLSLNY